MYSEKKKLFFVVVLDVRRGNISICLGHDLLSVSRCHAFSQFLLGQGTPVRRRRSQM